jgi:hypothetical protein
MSRRRHHIRNHADSLDKSYRRLVVTGAIVIGALVVILVVGPLVVAACRLVAQFVGIICRAVGQV